MPSAEERMKATISHTALSFLHGNRLEMAHYVPLGVYVPGTREVFHATNALAHGCGEGKRPFDSAIVC